MSIGDSVAVGDETLFIDLLRHGRTVVGQRFLGWCDEPLSEDGERQMERALTGEREYDLLISSPLLRCATFARQWAAAHDTAIELEPAWRELHFGQWEGRDAATLIEEDAAALESFWSDPLHHAPPGGENLLEFAARVDAAWQTWLPRLAGKRVLLVSHGGVIRLLLCRWLGMPLENLFRLQVPHAGLSRVRLDLADGQWHPQLLWMGGDVD